MNESGSIPDGRNNNKINIEALEQNGYDITEDIDVNLLKDYPIIRSKSIYDDIKKN
jgi:hypothetical protein